MRPPAGWVRPRTGTPPAWRRVTTWSAAGAEAGKVVVEGWRCRVEQLRRRAGGRPGGDLSGQAEVAEDSTVIGAARRAIADAYYIPVERLCSAVAVRSSCNFIHLSTTFKIDVFVSKGRPFDREAAALGVAGLLGRALADAAS